MSGRDPQGKRALFETPAVEMSEESAERGRTAVFSTSTPIPGTAVVECSSCGVHTRIGFAEAIVRILSFTLWVPLKTHSRWMRCPSCERRAWCRVGWLD